MGFYLHMSNFITSPYLTPTTASHLARLLQSPLSEVGQAAIDIHCHQIYGRLNGDDFNHQAREVFLTLLTSILESLQLLIFCLPHLTLTTSPTPSHHIMPPKPAMTYKRISETIPCLFDLPGEVRNNIYYHYFDVRVSIHLIHPPSPPPPAGTSRSRLTRLYRPDPTVHISSVYHAHIDMDPDTDSKASPALTDLEISDHTITLGNRTALLRVCHAVYSEAKLYAYSDNVYVVLGNSPRNVNNYHQSLSLIPANLLDKVKRLSLDAALFCDTTSFTNAGFNLLPSFATPTWWQSENWTLLRLRMPNLQYLGLHGLSRREIEMIIKVLSSPTTVFLKAGTISRICLTLHKSTPIQNSRRGHNAGAGVGAGSGNHAANNTGAGAGTGVYTITNPNSAFLPPGNGASTGAGMAANVPLNGPQVTIPPLRTLTLNGSMSEDAELPNLDGSGFRGWELMVRLNDGGKKYFSYECVK
jgi:hypothetical protein